MVPPDQCVDVDRRGPSPSAQLLVGCSGQRGRWGEEGVRAPALALAFSRERARGETLRERVTSTRGRKTWSLLQVSVNFPTTRSVVVVMADTCTYTKARS